MCTVYIQTKSMNRWLWLIIYQAILSGLRPYPNTCFRTTSIPMGHNPERRSPEWSRWVISVVQPLPKGVSRIVRLRGLSGLWRSGYWLGRDYNVWERCNRDIDMVSFYFLSLILLKLFIFKRVNQWLFHVFNVFLCDDEGNKWLVTWVWRRCGSKFWFWCWLQTSRFLSLGCTETHTNIKALEPISVKYIFLMSSNHWSQNQNKPPKVRTIPKFYFIF